MRADRLLQLAEHLERGKLGHEKFDFTVFNGGPKLWDAPIGQKNICGSYGCAIGEMPVIAPDRWKFDGYGGQPTLLDSYCSGVDAAASDFGLPKEHADLLFIPQWEVGLHDQIGIEWLSGSATRYEVAANIRRYVAFQQAKEQAAPPAAI